MKLTDKPRQLGVTFAQNGDKNSLPDQSSQETKEKGLAAYDSGFPPITMTAIAAGGIPPRGTDFNGVLSDITSAIRYAQSGALYTFDSAFARAIGGYAKGAMVLSADASKVWWNTVEANSTDPDSAQASGWIVITSKGLYLEAGRNLSDVQNTNAARNNLGIYSKEDSDWRFVKKSDLIDSIYPVGIVSLFAQNKNPNQLFPGTTWRYIGEDRTIRLAKQDGSDVMQSGGSDSVILSPGNLPSHAHEFWAKTTWFDYGKRTTSTNGKHAHNVGLDFGDHAAYRNEGPRSVKIADKWTSAEGDHVHDIDIGGHDHTVSGTTSYTGNGWGFSVVNKHIKLMAWYRSA